MFFWLEKLKSFARLNEWKGKEKSKWLTKVHLGTKLNFALWLLISTINFIKCAQLLRQVRVLLNSQEIVGVAFVGAFAVSTSKVSKYECSNLSS